MKIPKVITENHIAYFVGDIKIKYRGNKIKDEIVSKRDFYDINIYYSEILNVTKTTINEYEKLKKDFIKIDLNDILIEKPNRTDELFQEDLKDLKIYDFSNHSFIRDNINYGIVKGKVFFYVPYTTTKTIMVEVPLKSKQEEKINSDIFDKVSSTPNFQKTANPNSNKPPHEPFSFFGCLFNLIGLIIALVVIIMTIFLFIKIWKMAIILILLFSVIWVFGYFGSYIFKAIKYLFFGVLAILLISIIFASLSHNTVRPKPVIDDTDYIVEDSEIPVWEEVIDTTKVDTTITDTVSTKKDFKYKTLSWRDYNNVQHSFKYKIVKDYYNKAKSNRANYVSYNNNWGQIYYNLYSNDYKYLDDFISKYDKLKGKLSRKEFAELIVSSIQYQPYVWILDVSCSNPNYSYEITKSGCSCLGYITRYAVQSPYEYITNQKGDCDTRSLILYAILKHYKYDVVLLTSDYYEHAIIGINLPSYGKYKNYRGKKYYVWETTAKNMRIGQLNASVSNMNLWKVTL